MVVYIIMYNDFTDDPHILGVFSSFQSAEDFIGKHRTNKEDSYTIETWTVGGNWDDIKEATI